MKTLSFTSRALRFGLLSITLLHGAACGVEGDDDVSGADGAFGEETAEAAEALKSGTREEVFITWYGFNDNSCQVEEQHACTNIAYPKSDGYPVKHNAAKEGKGTYDDPITFAAKADDHGKHGRFAPGTRIYVPSVRKYFIMEDQCADCASRHVDLWMGPQHKSTWSKLEACQDKLTIGSKHHPAGVIYVNPGKGLPVDTRPIFKDNTCTAHRYSNK